MKTPKKQALSDYAIIGFLLSAMFLAATLIFLLCFAVSDKTNRVGGALISVEKAVLDARLSSPVFRSLRKSAANPQFPEQKRDERQPAVTVNETIAVFEEFLTELHSGLLKASQGERDFRIYHRIYHDLAVKKLYAFDRHYANHMPERRSDDSIFLSVASYRDENCVFTLTEAFQQATSPDRIFVGLVQQNCVANCMSGVLVGGKVEPIAPDDDCYELFCKSDVGQKYCSHVRLLRVDESESLGPYTARYFASKLWSGETWFMQIDSHMTFAKGWDAQSVDMLRKAPSDKPVISHYPPGADEDFEHGEKRGAPRICDAVFSDSQVEHEIIRLEGCGACVGNRIDIPRFVPFVAAGYFVAHSDFLKDVPFDPFLPWVFMGEEIIMSARLWTFGYDIFAPTHSVVGHIYVRRHKPKYWESVGRFLGEGMDGLIEGLVIHRLKHQLGYPESAPDVVWPKDVFYGVEHYTMGKERSVVDYMKLVGLDPARKELSKVWWCELGVPPDYAKDKAYLYEKTK
ncbi:glycosyltransferase [Fragilaria crotonensis]|nr:glycosyltransferase [Fragilaria crotonensis]